MIYMEINRDGHINRQLSEYLWESRQQNFTSVNLKPYDNLLISVCYSQNIIDENDVK